MRKKSLQFLLLFVVSAGIILAAPVIQGQTPAQANPLEKSVFSAVLTSPHYGVFDALSFKLDGTDVTLLGQVMFPITKDEAGRRTAKIPGIGKVKNDIEVLPLSRSDDALRIEIYRNLFSTADLYRYSLGFMPSIHIIVNNGRVTLEGYVLNEQDRNFAALAVRGIPGIFLFTNNLKIEAKNPSSVAKAQ